MRLKNTRNTIIIADDDLFVRKVIGSVLSPLADVVEVADGAEVLATYKKTMPDILFLDIHLPHQSGLDILGHIVEYDPEAYIIMLSADSSMDNVTHVQKFGVKGFLTKPFPRQRIMKYLQSCPTIVFLD
ncbi:MAG: response regulator [Proteobacteria bacterium]|nr:response regulator [Pseudomonadota bacterium]